MVFFLSHARRFIAQCARRANKIVQHRLLAGSLGLRNRICRFCGMALQKLQNLVTRTIGHVLRKKSFEFGRC